VTRQETNLSKGYALPRLLKEEKHDISGSAVGVGHLQLAMLVSLGHGFRMGSV
jgi:hypothetical protein